MKKSILFVFAFTCIYINATAQLVSYTLQQSFTKAGLDSFLSNTGFALPIGPQYDIDVYQVIYKTPYKHIDSLVNVSGIVVIPKNTPCPSSLGCYAHGTFSKRTQVPSYEGPERPIGFFFAGIGGVVTAMPDELGLGDSDTSVLIHPYINKFHSGYASINIMRAARQLAAQLNVPLNGEVVLTGYSQGGYTTMATNKLIQESFPNEFNVIASAPMSGPYDLKVTMVNVMLSTAPFSSPSYLPYLLLGHHSVNETMQQIFPTPSHIFKHPYDSIIPPLFYSKNFSTGQIDQFCDPVPRNMILDSVVDAFANNLQHPFRIVLEDNDLLGWAPQNPVKIHYCTADEQVDFRNALRADTIWRQNGSPFIEIQNFGNLTHGGCVEPALTSAAFYLLGKVSACTGIPKQDAISHRVFPNPNTGQFSLTVEPGEYRFSIYNTNGQLVYNTSIVEEVTTFDFRNIPDDLYVTILETTDGQKAFSKLLLTR